MKRDYSEVIKRIDEDRAKYEACITKTDRKLGFGWKHQQERREDLIRTAIDHFKINYMDEQSYMQFICELMLQAEAIKKKEAFQKAASDIREFARGKWKYSYNWYNRNYGSGSL